MYRRVVGTDSIQRIKDGAFIPANPENRDYQVFLAWLAEGNTLMPAVQPDPQETVSRETQALLDVLAPLVGTSPEALAGLLAKALQGKV